MKNAVLVRSTLRTWDCLLGIIVGILMIATAIFLYFFIGPKIKLFAFLLAPAGLLVAVAAAGVWWQRVRQQMWAWDAGDGLIVCDRLGEHEILDDDVLTLGLIYKNHYAGGQLSYYTRKVIIDFAGPNDRVGNIVLTTDFQPGEVDRLAPLINRVNNRLVEQALADLRDGHKVGGARWEWTDNEITIFEGKESKSFDLEEVIATDILDDHVCIWIHGQDDAHARLPSDSSNAYLLDQLLQRDLKDRPATDRPIPEGSLGRIIFERNHKKYFTWALGATVACCLIGLILASASFFINDRTPALLIGLGIILVGALLAWYTIWCVNATFRCHELGVYKRGISSEQTLRYIDVEAFTYSAIRQFVNGAYTGTTLSMQFEARDAKNNISYNTTLANPDNALDNLRDHISGVLAGKMKKDIDEGYTVDWTPDISFDARGILWKPSGWFKSKQPEQRIRFADMGTYDIQEGIFYIWMPGEKKPLLSVPASTRNFFPGFYLFATLFQNALSRSAPPPLPDATL